MKKLLLLFIFPLTANSALYDRGDGMIYDDVLDLTWLQDARSGQGENWSRDWAGSVEWVSQLTYAGHTDWRLPSLSVSGGAPIGSVAAGNQVDCAIASEAECRNNELGYMFYYNLGGSSGEDLTGDQGLFTNIDYAYWTGTQWAGNPISAAWNYHFTSGGDAANSKLNNYSIWAVADGDIASVPVPAAAWLFGSAILGLATICRKRNIK